MDEVRAQAKFIRGSHYKLRRYADIVRGKGANEAVSILQMHHGTNVKEVLKVVQSAIANAENNHDFDASELFVKEIFIDQGPVMKRFRPRARGRATPIRKHLSHITVKLAAKVED